MRNVIFIVAEYENDQLSNDTKDRTVRKIHIHAMSAEAFCQHSALSIQHFGSLKDIESVENLTSACSNSGSEMSARTRSY